MVGDVTIKKLTVHAQVLVYVFAIQLAVDIVSFTVVIANNLHHKIIAHTIFQEAAVLVALCSHAVVAVVQCVIKAVQQLTITTVAQWPAVVAVLDILTDAVVSLHSADASVLCTVTANSLAYAARQPYKVAAEHVMLI